MEDLRRSTKEERQEEKGNKKIENKFNLNKIFSHSFFCIKNKDFENM